MNTRKYWIEILVKTARPVFEALADDKLRMTMPVEFRGERRDRSEYAHLEAVGRSLAGIGPWLEGMPADSAEKQLQKELGDLVRRGLRHGVNPDSADYFNWNRGNQPIVDASFLAMGLLRCWNSVWLKLDGETQDRMVNCMKSSRVLMPHFNNWLLFSAMIEAFLCKACDADESDWDSMRIDYALKQHEQWYKGDGVYGDGPDFHWDYYNSFVIQPYLYEILHSHPVITGKWGYALEKVTDRLIRYGAVQERLISPEGAFPPIGRSLVYRYGAFQVLALTAQKGILDASLTPAGVRCALTAVIKRMSEREGVYDEKGWLRPGFAGHQPSLGENYISTGSLYLCLCGLLPLGLAETDPFWSDPDADWTAKRIWQGEDLPCDHALK